MKLLQSAIFVVLQVTRGRSTVITAFNEELHAQKFIAKIKESQPGAYVYQESTLHDFAPSEDEQVGAFECNYCHRFGTKCAEGCVEA